MSDLMIISADSHASEPSSLFERLPEEYRRRAPRTEERNGGIYYIQDGQRPLRQDIATSQLTEEDKRREFRSDEGAGQGREAGTDLPLRIADLEEDGVNAEVIYPNGIFNALASPDPGYQVAFSRLYNDWYHEVFGDNMERFVPSAMIPMGDIDGSVKEARRTAKLGYRSFSLPVLLSNLPYNRPDYEKFWDAMDDVKVPLSFHVFTGTDPIPEDMGEENSHGAGLIYIGLGMTVAMAPLTMLTASGVLERHPELNFVLVECGIGWLAWYLNVLDELYDKRHMWQQPKLSLKPSEYWKRQGYVTFGDDEVGLRNRDITGVDCLMWGSDYPHDEGTFPHSREVIGRTFSELPEEETRKIVGENAAKLYGFPLS